MNEVTRRTRVALISGLGGALAIGVLALLSSTQSIMLLIAPFGASCVLLFALPQNPVAQPKNVIGGHFLSALTGLIVLFLLGNGLLALSISVGLAIAIMQLTDTIHPPAGGTPLVVIMAGAGWSFLFLPILLGTIALVLIAMLYHKLISKRAYPV